MQNLLLFRTKFLETRAFIPCFTLERDLALVSRMSLSNEFILLPSKFQLCAFVSFTICCNRMHKNKTNLLMSDRMLGRTMVESVQKKQVTFETSNSFFTKVASLTASSVAFNSIRGMVYRPNPVI